MKQILWGFQTYARFIYNQFDQKPPYIVALNKNELMDAKNYPQYPVISMDAFRLDIEPKKILLTNLYKYYQESLLLSSLGFKEGFDFYAAFEYLPLEDIFQAQGAPYNNWKDYDELQSIWDKRIYQMSAYLKDMDSVLDIGCGYGHLKKYLPSGTKYFACDYKVRFEGMYCCDLEQYEFPNISVDTMFVSGCMEYISTSLWLFQMLQGAKKRVVLSYLTLECMSNIKRRKILGYKNHYSIHQIIEHMEQNNFTLGEIIHGWTGDLLFLFTSSTSDKTSPNRDYE